MFVHILCAVVLLSAFTAHGENECADYPSLEDFCWDMERTGRCKSKDPKQMKYAEVYCPKTCNLCWKVTCADHPKKQDICRYIKQTGKCRTGDLQKSATKYCRKTCGLC